VASWQRCKSRKPTASHAPRFNRKRNAFGRHGREVLESVAMLNETDAQIYKLALGGNNFAVRIFVLILLQA